ncbi:MAG TPA: YciI family protein [Kofleriaceae bacterium]|nr:YciI family protein [Kofleriaceae bacterium]
MSASHTRVARRGGFLAGCVEDKPGSCMVGRVPQFSALARVRFEGNSRTVLDGPFAETKELVAGYWLIQVKSREEVIEWVKRCPDPLPGSSEIEIRPLFEMEDFPQAAAETVERAARIDAQIKRH